jgi:hypothetical protein
LKNPARFTGRSWGEFAATCARAADVWTPRDRPALDLLLAADSTLKTRISSDEQLLSRSCWRCVVGPLAGAHE